MYYIGIDIGGTNIVAGVTDDEGKIHAKAECKVDKSWDDRVLSEMCVTLAREATERAGVDPGEIQSVGIGVPGLVFNETGVVVKTANMPFANTPLRDIFQSRWQLPVYMSNDANCAAIGEYWCGAVAGCDPVVVITLGTGIGGGMVSNGKLFTGFAQSGMEVGHMVLHPGGEPCGCGNRGCWEQYASATALVRMAREEMSGRPESLLWDLCQGDAKQVDGRIVFEGAKRGDLAAQLALEQFRRELALGLINLVNILQPQVICIGGGISHADEAQLLIPLQKLMTQGCFDKERPPRLVRAALGNDAGIVGAAMLCKLL